MEYVIGAGLALFVTVFATLTGFDRDKALYPSMAILVASYYVLFAVLGGSRDALLVESAFLVAYLLAALAAFRWSLWVAAIALVSHGVIDFFHGGLVANPGVPPWWPGFCLSFDVVAGVYLAWRLARRHAALAVHSP